MKKYKHILIAVTIVISIVATIIGIKLTQNYKSIKLDAASDQANIFIQSSQTNISTKSTFQVWVTVGNPVGFVATEIGFNKSLIKLSNEVDLAPSVLTKKILVTSMAEANNTGKIKIVVGLDPNNKSNPPNGAFRIADLVFSPNTQNKDVSTSLTINNSLSQVVGMNSSNFTVTSQNTSLVVNPSSAVNKVGDINGDGLVNMVDIGIIVDNYNSSPILNIKADLNNDNIVNIVDIGIAVDNYGK